MKPNIEADLRRATIEQALDTIDRRVNELGVAEPNISEYGQTGDQILVELPGARRRRAGERDHPLDGGARRCARRGGPGRDARGAAAALRREVPGDMEILTGAGATGARGRCSTWSAGCRC
jgi:hypothetical protein